MLQSETNSTAYNKGFSIAGVPCFEDTFVQGGSSVLRMKFSAKTPRHRPPETLKHNIHPLNFFNNHFLYLCLYDNSDNFITFAC